MKHALTAILAVMLLAAASCAQRGELPAPANAVYWWKTVWSPDSAEYGFIARHKIEKIYMRFFDVVPATNSTTPQPVATIKINAPTANLKIIPTVFITESCMNLNIDKMPKMLAYRVLQMCETNDIVDVDEIQIDCDWTSSSQQKYFDFLSRLREILHGKGIRLSATIRMHQLRMAPPPVDYGTLMVYNTASLTQLPLRTNPILSYSDALPYIKNIKNYDLALCAAYPDFSYNLLYSDNLALRAILYNEDTADSSKYRRISDNEYISIANRLTPNSPEPGSGITQINYGDHLMIYKADFEQIEKTKAAIEGIRPDIAAQTIIYDLNSRNINNLTNEQYEKILSH